MNDVGCHPDLNDSEANPGEVLRVVVLLVGTEDSGIARFLLNQLTVSRRFGIQFEFLCLRSGAMVDALKEAGESVTVCHGVAPKVARWGPVLAWVLWLAPLGGSWSTVSKAAVALRASSPDVVYTHSLVGHLVGGLACRRLRIPALAQFHGALNPGRMFGFSDGAISAILSALFDRGVAISEYVRRSLGRKMARKTEVVYNSVDGATIKLAASKATKVPGRLVMVGRMVPLKKFETAIEAVLILSRQGVSCSLDIIGGPVDVSNEYFMRLKRLVEGSGLKDRVSFLGVVSPPYERVASAEVFMSCATIEGFGLAVVEAMACGTPVVVADVGGPAEIVVEGRSGLHFRSDDPSSLARCLKNLLEKPEQKSRMVEAALEQAQQEFGVEQHMGGVRRNLEAAAARTSLRNSSPRIPKHNVIQS